MSMNIKLCKSMTKKQKKIFLINRILIINITHLKVFISIGQWMFLFYIIFSNIINTPLKFKFKVH